MDSIGTKEEPLLLKIATSLPGVWELRPHVYGGARGFAYQSYSQARFAEVGITDTFVEDNRSCSVKGTLRGLHYQLRHPQARLCQILTGEAWIVALDIRSGSPNFGKWTSVVLSSSVQNQVYIPRGFAHGFVALTEWVEDLCKCSDFSDSADEHVIFWNDAQIAMRWDMVGASFVSERDQIAPRLAGSPRELLPIY